MHRSSLSSRSKVIFGTIILLLIALVVIGFVLYSSLIKPPPGHADVKINIKPGSKLRDIGALLADKGVVKNGWTFSALARWQGNDKIVAGDYYLKQGMTASEALDGLVQGPKIKEYIIAIPEGFTIENIAERLSARTKIDGEEFRGLAQTSAHSEDLKPYDFLNANPTTTLEGYLFPKTYMATEDTEAMDFILMLLNQYQKETAGLGLPKDTNERNMNSYNILTIASLIEAEAKIDEERRLISAVIYNRLSKNMKLQIDATVQYALPERKTSLSTQDLKVDSPYNTYLHQGLPPGPICNPGLASIQAALDPAPVNYLYYVLTDASGKHAFTDSYQDFLKEKQKAQGR